MERASRFLYRDGIRFADFTVVGPPIVALLLASGLDFSRHHSAGSRTGFRPERNSPLRTIALPFRNFYCVIGKRNQVPPLPFSPCMYEKI